MAEVLTAQEVRLRLAEALIPVAARNEISNEDALINKLSQLEKFVLGSVSNNGSKSAPVPAGKRGGPRKG